MTKKTQQNKPQIDPALAGSPGLWPAGWRAARWSELSIDPNVDVLVIGGGITGAGIIREAARAGLRVLLVERDDFASGTSSRSSKMVHGGLRYLANYQLGLTRDSVRERRKLMQQLPGLANPLWFLLGVYQGQKPNKTELSLGLFLYDQIAGKRSRRFHNLETTVEKMPGIEEDGLLGSFTYLDAATDDTRLTQRFLQEGVADGGIAMNYVEMSELIRDDDGNVCGALLNDRASGKQLKVSAKVVINAAGAQADLPRKQLGLQGKLRPVRGSHLVVPASRLPLDSVLAFADPKSPKRTMFAYPWEGVTLIGTTDLDHEGVVDSNPKITAAEYENILSAVNAAMPNANIAPCDVICSFSGIRPIVGTGVEDSSDESRHHEVWIENGLMTVTGGKLTTFRLTAIDALKKARSQLGMKKLKFSRRNPMVAEVDSRKPDHLELSDEVWLRLSGRYGNLAHAVVAAAKSTELYPINSSHVCLAELRWAARAEAVEHLGDLLLRRTRLGMTLPDAAAELFPAVRNICAEELGWDNKRWTDETNQYKQHYANYYLA